jgi:hypothetical protein
LKNKKQAIIELLNNSIMACFLSRSSNCGGSHSNKIKIEIGQDVNQAI